MEFDRVASVIAGIIGADAADITPESTFESLKVDSLDMVEIIMELESEFGVAFEDNLDIKNVSDLVEYIQQNQ